MNQKQHKKWSKSREKGEKRFVWFQGVLLWGVCTALFWSVLMEFLVPNENIFVRPIIAIILFPIGGYGWGKWVWKITEKKYFEFENMQ